MIRYNPKGLSSQEAADSRRTHGDNVITPPKDDSAWKLFVEKFKEQYKMTDAKKIHAKHVMAKATGKVVKLAAAKPAVNQ